MQTQARLYLNSQEGLLVLLEQPMDFQSIVVESDCANKVKNLLAQIWARLKLHELNIGTRWRCMIKATSQLRSCNISIVLATQDDVDAASIVILVPAEVRTLLWRDGKQRYAVAHILMWIYTSC